MHGYLFPLNHLCRRETGENTYEYDRAASAWVLCFEIAWLPSKESNGKRESSDHHIVKETRHQTEWPMEKKRRLLDVFALGEKIDQSAVIIYPFS